MSSIMSTRAAGWLFPAGLAMMLSSVLMAEAPVHGHGAHPLPSPLPAVSQHSCTDRSAADMGEAVFPIVVDRHGVSVAPEPAARQPAQPCVTGRTDRVVHASVP